MQSRETILPAPARQRCIELRLAVDDLEAQRSSLQKRMGAIRPDETQERAALQERMTACSNQLSHAKSLLNRVDTWLQDIGAFHHTHPTVLQDADPVKPKKVSVERLADVRENIVRLQAQQRAILNAPVPFEVLENRVRAQVAAWAKEAEPSIVMKDQPGSIGVPGRDAGSVNFDHADIRVPPYKLLAWFDEERMVERLMQKAEAVYPKDASPALSEQERKEALRDGRKTIFKLELEECAIVDALRGKTHGVQHRLTVSPAALLGVIEPSGAIRTALVA